MLCSTNEKPFRITNIEKYQVIDSIKTNYTVEKLAALFNISSRSYRKLVFTIKRRTIRRIGKESKFKTKKSIKKYVQWYNTERIQKALDYQSHIQF